MKYAASILSEQGSGEYDLGDCVGGDEDDLLGG